MKLPTLGELVKNNQRTYFKSYGDNCLWYETSNIVYPVPIEEAKGGVWLAEEKAILHMRWIRKHLEYLKEALDESKKLDD